MQMQYRHSVGCCVAAGGPVWLGTGQFGGGGGGAGCGVPWGLCWLCIGTLLSLVIHLVLLSS